MQLMQLLQQYISQHQAASLEVRYLSEGPDCLILHQPIKSEQLKLMTLNILHIGKIKIACWDMCHIRPFWQLPKAVLLYCNIPYQPRLHSLHSMMLELNDEMLATVPSIFCNKEWQLLLGSVAALPLTPELKQMIATQQVVWQRQNSIERAGNVI